MRKVLIACGAVLALALCNAQVYAESVAYEDAAPFVQTSIVGMLPDTLAERLCSAAAGGSPIGAWFEERQPKHMLASLGVTMPAGNRIARQAT